MSQNMTVDLTEEQRNTLLQGLRFVRSSLMLNARDPDPTLDARRDERLKEIATLTDWLSGTPVTSEVSQVS